jgi:hypothetical protein
VERAHGVDVWRTMVQQRGQLSTCIYTFYAFGERCCMTEVPAVAARRREPNGFGVVTLCLSSATGMERGTKKFAAIAWSVWPSANLCSMDCVREEDWAVYGTAWGHNLGAWAAERLFAQNNQQALVDMGLVAAHIDGG